MWCPEPGAFFNPIRKVRYNLAITGLSVAICFAIGAVEALSLLPQEIHGLSRTTGFWVLMISAASVAGWCLGRRPLGLWACLPEAGHGPPQLSA